MDIEEFFGGIMIVVIFILIIFSLVVLFDFIMWTGIWISTFMFSHLPLPKL